MTRKQQEDIDSALDEDENIQALRRMSKGCRDRLKELEVSGANESMIHRELRNLTALNIARDALADRIIRQKGLL